MGKALVLKNGVDFSANAVATIEFADIQCTGITFAQNAYTVSGYDDVEVEYTVTPSDTTDSVIWTSSNTDIVSISNGVMTINGIGTCTITATCGAFTATATVTVSIAYIPHWVFRALNGSTNLFVSYGALDYNRIAAFGIGVQACNYDLPNSATRAESPYPIKLPKNTAKVKISATSDQFYDSDNTVLYWLKDEPSGSADYPNSAKYVSRETLWNMRTTPISEHNVPDGVDAMAFVTRLRNPATSEADANNVVESLGLTIEFIPAE